MAVWKQCPSALLEHHGPALFLDRDGVVISDRDYLADPALVEIISGSDNAIKAARETGFAVMGVSNQSGLGRGKFGPGEFKSVMEKIEHLLATAGAEFDGFFYCPHAPEDNCDCRKPRPGLLTEAALSCTWDPLTSWVVGDKTCDVALGRDNGMGAALVRTGYGEQYVDEVLSRWPDDPRVIVADDLWSAWLIIRDQPVPGGGP